MRAGLGVGGGWGLSLTRTGGKGRREHPARGRWDHAHTVIHVIHRDTRAAHTQAGRAGVSAWRGLAGISPTLMRAQHTNRPASPALQR